jgi:hypothetical protein
MTAYGKKIIAVSIILTEGTCVGSTSTYKKLLSVKKDLGVTQVCLISMHAPGSFNPGIP